MKEAEVLKQSLLTSADATVENMNNALLRIVLNNPGTPEAGIWLASWGDNPVANQLFEWRWVNALQKMLH